MSMHTGRLSIQALAAALLLGSVLVGTAPVAAQETTGAPPSEPLTEASAPKASARGTDQSAAAQDQDRHGSKKKGRGVKRGGVPLQPGSTLPPTNLKKVGDHWTPYDPPDPESFPPDATLHIIVPGDTLWDLADLVFGNPYLWPQIWNENRYIQDSHWIYPGDPLLLPARPTVVGEIVPQGQEGAPPVPQAVAPEKPQEAEQPPVPEEEEEEAPMAAAPPPAPPAPRTAHAPRTVPKLEPLADDYDIRCSGFIAPREEKPDYFIANQ